MFYMKMKMKTELTERQTTDLSAVSRHLSFERYEDVQFAIEELRRRK